MTDDSTSAERDPVDLLAEEFVRRMRAGESVSVEAFAVEHEAYTDTLRELLPTLQALEQVKRDRESTGGLKARVALPAMRQLGDFRIVCEIGRGGMGVVFEAVQESLSRKVALKVLPQASLLTGNQLRRFQREAQIAAKLHHSNIVPVFGSGETDGYHWYAMQFIDGDGLDKWSKDERERQPNGSAAWRERAMSVARMGEQAASALQYAHEQGTLHRDIKPANLLLEHHGHVWVTDFGLAKALESEGLTHSGDLLGTLQYMAPEQFSGQYDARSEVYALGVTLYELLTLRPAYAGKTKSELMDAIQRGRTDSLRHLCPQVPSDLITVIEKACARESRDRYASAEDLQHDLQAFLEDRPIAARRHSAAGLLLRWCRRNRAMAAFATATVLAVLGAAITGWAAYVLTDEALTQAKTSGDLAIRQSLRAEANLRLSLAAFEDVFDALVGRDPVLMFEEDPDTGEQTVVTSRAVDDDDVALLTKILKFYDGFAAQNAESQTLRFETARAYRRVGVIQARLGKLEEATKAYDQALERYLDVTDRDITRELAAVHVEYGQLETRRRNPRQAAVRFRRALKLLELEPAGSDSSALRFDRAKAQFLLARNAAWSTRGERGYGRERGPGGRRRPGSSRRPDVERPTDSRSKGEDARNELEAARKLLGTLSAEDGLNPEVRALEARCLVLSARLPHDDRDQQLADGKAGLEIFRELVAAQPLAAHLRLELCDELLGLRYRPDLGGRLLLLLEARTHCDELVRQQPTMPDYRAMRSRIGSELGAHMIRKTHELAGEEKIATLDQAETELRFAIAQDDMVALSRADRRFGSRAIMAAGQLDQLLRAAGRSAEADADLDRFLLGLRALVSDSGRRSFRFGGRGGWRGDPRRERPQQFSEQFRARLTAFRESLPREPERGGRGRPPEPNDRSRRGR